MASFSSQDLVQLPRLSGVEAVLLIREMLAEAVLQPSLPGPIDRSRRRLAVALATLETALAAAPVDRRSEKSLDAAWEATFDWLSGWCKLAAESNPYRAAARALFKQAFGDALDNDRLPYRAEPSESAARLAAIDREGYATTFAMLGGAAFLDQIRRAHFALEQASAGTVAGSVRHPLATAAGTLRQYVVRAASHADPDVPGSEALSEALLRPLVRWYRLHPSRGPEAEFAAVEVTQY